MGRPKPGVQLFALHPQRLKTDHLRAAVFEQGRVGDRRLRRKKRAHTSRMRKPVTRSPSMDSKLIFLGSVMHTSTDHPCRSCTSSSFELKVGSSNGRFDATNTERINGGAFARSFQSVGNSGWAGWLLV